MRAARTVMLVVGVLALFAVTPAGAQTLRLSPGSLFESPQSVGLEAMAQTALRRAQQKQSLTSRLERHDDRPCRSEDRRVDHASDSQQRRVEVHAADRHAAGVSASRMTINRRARRARREDVLLCVLRDLCG